VLNIWLSNVGQMDLSVLDVGTKKHGIFRNDICLIAGVVVIKQVAA
jgi:hypothetical protein